MDRSGTEVETVSGGALVVSGSGASNNSTEAGATTYTEVENWHGSDPATLSTDRRVNRLPCCLLVRKNQDRREIAVIPFLRRGGKKFQSFQTQTCASCVT